MTEFFIQEIVIGEKVTVSVHKTKATSQDSIYSKDLPLRHWLPYLKKN